MVQLLIQIAMTRPNLPPMGIITKVLPGVAINVCGCVQAKESDFEGQQDLITDLPQDWGNRLLEGTNKTLGTPGPGERSSDSTRD